MLHTDSHKHMLMLHFVCRFGGFELEAGNWQLTFAGVIITESIEHLTSVWVKDLRAENQTLVHELIGTVLLHYMRTATISRFKHFLHTCIY